MSEETVGQKGGPQNRPNQNRGDFRRNSGAANPAGPNAGGHPQRRDRNNDRDRHNDRDRNNDRGNDRSNDRGGDRRSFRPDAGPDIDLDQLLRDSLYLDNQAHVIVSRLRDLDTGTRSQLRRLYNAARRACRAKDAERQHEFVMFRARLAYTIARHSLRSLDPLEKLLLQVTRRNEARAYERFRDLFEAIIAYNE